MSDVKFFGFVIFLYVMGAAIFGSITYTSAPPAGGEFWPYIRIIVTMIAGLIGGKLFVFTLFGSIWILVEADYL